MGFPWLAKACVLAAVLSWAAQAQAQGGAPAPRVGEVEFSHGAGFAQSPGQSPRILGRGLALREGDRLTTADGASALLRLDDGSRLALRPASELVLRSYQPQQSGQPGHWLLELLRGGLRTVSGLIAHQGPDAAQVQTPLATIGLRGTDVELRLCGADCAPTGPAEGEGRANTVLASARVLGIEGGDGLAHALDAEGTRRWLAEGGSLYPGETLETGAGMRALMVLRDGSRVALGPATRLRIEDFVYDPGHPAEGRVVLRLLAGQVRAVGGRIAQADAAHARWLAGPLQALSPEAGLDLRCEGGCAPGDVPRDLLVCNWREALAVLPQERAELLRLPPAACLQFAGGPPRPAPAASPALARPDQARVAGDLFALRPLADTRGLFVRVHDGQVAVDGAAGLLHLGRGETGFASQGLLLRPAELPPVLAADCSPSPGVPQAAFAGLFRGVASCAPNLCR